MPPPRQRYALRDGYELVRRQAPFVRMHTDRLPRSEPKHSYRTAIDVAHRLPFVERRPEMLMRRTSGSGLVREILGALIVLIPIGFVLSVEIRF